MRHSVSAVLRSHRILETRLVVDMLQRRGYKVPITGGATRPKLIGRRPRRRTCLKRNQVCQYLQRFYGDLAEGICDIDTEQHDGDNRAMALAEVQDPSTSIPEDVTKLTWWGSGEISFAVLTRTVSISCKRQVMDNTQLPNLYGAQG